MVARVGGEVGGVGGRGGREVVRAGNDKQVPAYFFRSEFIAKFS